MVVHNKRSYADKYQYCHMQCYNKQAIEKISRFRTNCTRCNEVIEAKTPIEKWKGKWVHIGFPEQVDEHQKMSDYEILVNSTLIKDDSLDDFTKC